jgi:hypothetical protein
MKDQLLMAAVVGVGFLAGLAIAAARGDLRRPIAAPLQELAEPAAPEPLPAEAARPLMLAPGSAAPLPIQPAAAQPAITEPQHDQRESAAALAAPTYDQEFAARDRAAARGARSH